MKIRSPQGTEEKGDKGADMAIAIGKAGNSRGGSSSPSARRAKHAPP